ncbi:hypothetical protein B0H21DRAFT_891713 [Amylocystis lapponica]|nr:hypothetical protein B0H21DRAFT_894888 [Amylocystis lapponica]KAH9946928.1 hypothetical protein B0H21DRAFT_891713 [Amylocystis lapponica]
MTGRSWPIKTFQTLDAHMEELHRFIQVAFQTRLEYELYHVWNWILLWIVAAWSDDERRLSIAPQPVFGRIRQAVQAQQEEEEEEEKEEEEEEVVVVVAEEDKDVDEPADEGAVQDSQDQDNDDDHRDSENQEKRLETGTEPNSPVLENSVAQLSISNQGTSNVVEEHPEAVVEEAPEVRDVADAPSKVSPRIPPDNYRFIRHRTPDFATYATLRTERRTCFVVFIHEMKPWPNRITSHQYSTPKQLDELYEKAFLKACKQITEQAQLVFEDYPETQITYVFRRHDTPAFDEYTPKAKWYNASNIRDVVDHMSHVDGSSQATDFTFAFKLAWTAAFQHLKDNMAAYEQAARKRAEDVAAEDHDSREATA